MQKLFFEDAWERTISKKDHDHICQIFSGLVIHDGISFTYLWDAVNHREDRLLTTIIHNKTETALRIQQMPLQFEADDTVFYGEFSLPIIIPAYHSMPWTFIFTPTSTINKDHYTAYQITKTDNGK